MGRDLMCAWEALREGGALLFPYLNIENTLFYSVNQSEKQELNINLLLIILEAAFLSLFLTR